MNTIDLALQADEVAPHTWAAELSELQWKRLTKGVKPIGEVVGNGRPFVFFHAQKDAEGDLQFVTFVQESGFLVLKVFND